MSIVLTNVTKSFSKPPIPMIKNINLTIEKGEFVSLTGKSGSGKSTLLYLISSLDMPTSGTIEIDGNNISKMNSKEIHSFRNKNMGFIFQFHYLLPEFTSLENVLMPARKAGLIEEKSKLAEELFEKFDLKEKIWNRVDRLSGGERQRVGLARVLMSNAELWLVDEPLSALDPKRSKQAINTLIAEANKRGATLVVTLHQVDVATSEFPRVIGLKDGRLDFDLASNLVTKEILQELYAQNQHEISSIEPHEILTHSSFETPKISSLCKPQ